GWSVAGTELDPSRGFNHGIRIESSLASLTDLGPIDVATMWHSLEHVPEPMPLLTALRQQMQPRGTLFVAVPNIQSAQARMTGGSWLHLDVPRHLSHFGPAGLQRALEDGGFEIVRWWHQEFEYDLIGWSQSALSVMHPEESPDFFNWLSHRAVEPSPRRKVNIVAGVGLTALAAPVVPIMAAIRQGSTIIVAARVRA
ncbi:MAG TPA: methyltransferase domain-containing protein, partial [Acidimicrobiales bacterium]|nr:methyltransferase domain-containing protein [Acidimicrobiales bacterium]